MRVIALPPSLVLDLILDLVLDPWSRWSAMTKRQQTNKLSPGYHRRDSAKLSKFIRIFQLLFLLNRFQTALHPYPLERSQPRLLNYAKKQEGRHAVHRMVERWPHSTKMQLDALYASLPLMVEHAARFTWCDWTPKTDRQKSAFER